jgi:uncharacterized protein YjbJ (UPF0337 family)
MNQDTIQGNWMQLKGKIKEQWGRLTDDDLDVIAGKRDQLLGKVQERYGWARDKAEEEVGRWERDHALGPVALKTKGGLGLRPPFSHRFYAAAIPSL